MFLCFVRQNTLKTKKKAQFYVLFDLKTPLFIESLFFDRQPRISKQKRKSTA